MLEAARGWNAIRRRARRVTARFKLGTTGTVKGTWAQRTNGTGPAPEPVVSPERERSRRRLGLGGASRRGDVHRAAMSPRMGPRGRFGCRPQPATATQPKRQVRSSTSHIPARRNANLNTAVNRASNSELP